MLRTKKNMLIIIVRDIFKVYTTHITSLNYNNNILHIKKMVLPFRGFTNYSHGAFYANCLIFVLRISIYTTYFMWGECFIVGT